MFPKSILSERYGFTIWEMLLVLVIIGIIIFMAVPRYLNTTEHVQDQTHKANILMLEGAARQYYLDTGSYPEDIDDLLERPENIPEWKGPYLEERLECPYGTDQTYVFNTRGRALLR